MIPASFEYHRPTDLSGVIDLIQKYGDDSRVVAGGHSLIPMMKLRMAEVPHLIDLQDVDGLAGIEIKGKQIRIGAMTTLAEMINDAKLAKAAPVLRETGLQIADPQVRYMGTVGGNAANGDPGNDLPGLMQCLDAQYVLVGPKGERTIAAREFYESAYVTARQNDEVLTAVCFEQKAGGYAYEKQKRKIGDYATAAAAVHLIKEKKQCSFAAISMTNLSDTPIFSQAAGEALIGQTIDEAATKNAVTAMLNDIDPVEDNRGPVAFKRHVAGVILSRAIARAWSHA